MKKILLYIPILLITFNLQMLAQSPGGVGTANLTAWFNPDVLTPGNVTSWSTMYPAGAAAITLTDATAPYPVATNTPTGNTSNYNTTIDFAGNATGTNSTARALEYIGTLDLLDNRISTSQGTFFAAYLVNDNASGGQHILDYRESVGDAIQFRFLSPTATRLAIGTSGSSTNASRNFADNSTPMVFSYYGNRSSATSLNPRVKGSDVTVASASQAGTGGRIGMLVGARKNGSGNYLGAHRSFINELIFFNTDLGIIDLLRVESYLAIKYGTTLNPTSPTSGGYLSSDPLISTWDPNLAYHNDVIGIGRDDSSALNQKQSHSFDDAQRIYLGTLSASNTTNTGTFTNNISYAVMGHNNAALNETALATAEMPSAMNLVNRIEREWCLKNTNLSNAFSVDITLNNFTNFSSNPADLVLLIDDDGNFSNASVFQSGLSFAVNGNTVTVSGISTTQIPLNTTRYLTLATITIPAPVALKNFEAHQEEQGVRLNWSTGIEENFSHFGIEQSTNSSDWKEIGTATGKGSESNYAFYDHNPGMGINYYRLKMYDIDGQINYSTNQSITLADNGKVNIYPNPIINNRLHIEASSKALKSIVVRNTAGQNVTALVSRLKISDVNLQLNFEKLPLGIYFVSVGNSVYSVVK